MFSGAWLRLIADRVNLVSALDLLQVDFGQHDFLAGVGLCTDSRQ